MDQITLLKEEKDVEFLDSYGYIVYPLLNEQELAELLTIYEANKPSLDRDFYCSIDSTDKDYKRKIDAKIRQIIEKPLTKILKPFDLLTGNFIVKHPGKESIVYIHMDWAFADERDGAPLVIWIALHDTSRANGALEVVEGSHKIAPIVRGPGIKNTFLPYHDYLREKWARIKPIKAGEVILFKGSLIHCSPPNLSDGIRIAIRIEVVPKDRKMIIFHQPDSKKEIVDVYKIKPDFYTRYVKGDKPKEGEFLQSIKYKPPSFTKRKIRKALEKINKEFH